MTASGSLVGPDSTLTTRDANGVLRTSDGRYVSRSQFGERIGQGGEKDIFLIESNENLVAGVHRDGFVQYAQNEGLLSPIAKPDEINAFLHRQLSNEVESLNKLDGIGIPVVRNHGVIDVDGAPAIVLDRIPGAVSSHDAILFNNSDSLKKVLNQQSIEDLQLIRSKLVENNIGATDFQVLVRSDGRVFVNDPGRIFNELYPGNLRYIDQIIELAQ